MRNKTMTLGKLTDATLEDVIHKTVNIELWSVSVELWNINVKITSNDITITSVEDWMLVNHYGSVR